MKLRSAFVSDIHLGSKACRAEALLGFIEGLDVEYLFLVGDAIDLQLLQRRWHWEGTYRRVVDAVIGLAAGGTRVLYIPGNHDDQMRVYAGREFGGVRVMRQFVHRLADGRHLLVMHGDEYDHVIRQSRLLGKLGSLAYKCLVGANRPLNAARRHAGLDYWSVAEYCKRRNGRFLRTLADFRTAICAHAARRSCEAALVGHIHTAELRRHDDVLYCNTGDWVESCTAVGEDYSGRLHLIDGLSGAVRASEEPLAPRLQPFAEAAS